MFRIKAIREAKGISQKALAEAANVSAPFLFDLENGNRNAKAGTLERIAVALGCTVEELKEEVNNQRHFHTGSTGDGT